MIATKPRGRGSVLAPTNVSPPEEEALKAQLREEKAEKLRKQVIASKDKAEMKPSEEQNNDVKEEKSDQIKTPEKSKSTERSRSREVRRRSRSRDRRSRSKDKRVSRSRETRRRSRSREVRRRSRSREVRRRSRSRDRRRSRSREARRKSRSRDRRRSRSREARRRSRSRDRRRSRSREARRRSRSRDRRRSRSREARRRSRSRDRRSRSRDVKEQEGVPKEDKNGKDEDLKKVEEQAPVEVLAVRDVHAEPESPKEEDIDDSGFIERKLLKKELQSDHSVPSLIENPTQEEDEDEGSDVSTPWLQAPIVGKCLDHNIQINPNAVVETHTATPGGPQIPPPDQLIRQFPAKTIQPVSKPIQFGATIKTLPTSNKKGGLGNWSTLEVKESPKPVHVTKAPPKVELKISQLIDLIKCPITHEIMEDPVIAEDGFTYERAEVEKWFLKSWKSPMTNEDIPSTLLIPNKTLKSVIIEIAELRKRAQINADGEKQ